MSNACKPEIADRRPALVGSTGLAGAAPTATLPLGPAGLTETRTVRTVQPGVTLTTIVRGTVDPADFWTVEIAVPAGAGSPDPDAPAAALSDRADAEALAAKLTEAGFFPRVEEVIAPPTSDYAPGTLGWRVRLGHLGSKEESDAILAPLVAAKFAGASRFTGWDASSADHGPWRLQVLSIDPKTFSGRLLASFGANLEDRETASELSRAVGATAATNAGYFVLDPRPARPATRRCRGPRRPAVERDDQFRPALVLRADARRTQVERLHLLGVVASGSGELRLDGIDRVPGLIRNCGGRGDAPTNLPVHDFTCTDDGEEVAFTNDFGPSTPVGPGLEAVLDEHGRVVSLRSPRGGPLVAGYQAIQATGDQVVRLQRAAVLGQRLKVHASLLQSDGMVLRLTTSTSVVNGGPVLVQNGRVHVTPRRDGFVRPSSPSTYYGFSAERNPRTLAGVDDRGRAIIATADGRSTASLGLSITETGAVASALGMVDGLNLDGGGSTTMVAAAWWPTSRQMPAASGR